MYGGWTGLNENNAKSALTKVEVKVTAELGNIRMGGESNTQIVTFAENGKLQD